MFERWRSDMIRRLRRIYRDALFRRLITRRLTKFVTAQQSGLIAIHDLLDSFNMNTSVIPATKGEPDIVRIKSALATTVRTTLSDVDVSGPVDYGSACVTTRHLAAVDMRDERAFQLFLAVFSTHNQIVLQQLTDYLTPHVVLHMSCVPRIERAIASVASFRELEPDVSQLIVVGAGENAPLSFDANMGVLYLPVSDAYEHLPAKMVTAGFVLGLLPFVRCVLKVDDDHRLSDAAATRRCFSRYSQPRPLQAGVIEAAHYHGAYVRAWHFGKCQNAERNTRPYSLLGEREWINGASGYFLSRGALDILVWSYVYFEDAIMGGLYEDVTLSALLQRNLCKLDAIRMTRCIATVTGY
jgi:hypothetical protein